MCLSVVKDVLGSWSGGLRMLMWTSIDSKYVSKVGKSFSRKLRFSLAIDINCLVIAS